MPCSDIKEMRIDGYPEVLFPNEFRPQDPWNKKTLDFPDDTLSATIPIYRLVHITHPTEARHIEQVPNRRYEFIPKKKYGKSYQYSEGRFGETYEHIGDDNYKEILYKDLVFPGYLSWWGIDVRDWYKKDGCQLLQSISRERVNGRYVPGYLAAKPESPYGSVAFSIQLSVILSDYKKARKSNQGVCLKVGGTLQYRKEICYVVIVCLEDTDDDAFRETLNIAGPKLVSNGLVDSNGVVIDYNKIPKFKAASIIKSEKIGEDPTGENKYDYNYYSWEQLVFAFHFPTDRQSLVCTQVTKTAGYQHFAKNCQKC